MIWSVCVFVHCVNADVRVFAVRRYVETGRRREEAASKVLYIGLVRDTIVSFFGGFIEFFCSQGFNWFPSCSYDLVRWILFRNKILNIDLILSFTPSLFLLGRCSSFFRLSSVKCGSDYLMFVCDYRYEFKVIWHREKHKKYLEIMNRGRRKIWKTIDHWIQFFFL